MSAAAKQRPNTFSGTLEFRVGAEPFDTGVFLVSDGEAYEVLATTQNARAPLGQLEGQPLGLPARVAGVANGDCIEATAIEVLEPDNGLTACLGEALLELYRAIESEPPSVNPPRRYGNMYFHPSAHARALQEVQFDVGTHGCRTALYDAVDGEVWFRTVDLSAHPFVDITRGPFAVPAGGDLLSAIRNRVIGTRDR